MRQVIEAILKNAAALDLIKTFLTVLLGAAIPTIVNIMNNRHTRTMQMEQWKHEEEKAKRESEKKDKDRLFEQQQRQRSETIETYAKAVAYLSMLTRSSTLVQEPDLRRLYGLQPYLLKIQLDYPDKTSVTYKSFDLHLATFDARGTGLFAGARELRIMIMQLASEDSRLIGNGINDLEQKPNKTDNVIG